ncbi:MAG TPA: Hsp20/alpha crystallin family protein [Cryomorphaceae bacterium]|nr:Hsp20/alpha crystallin family protein [Cryomorphaceae bacterium]
MSLIKFNRAPSIFDPFDSIFNDFFEGEMLPRRTGRSANVPSANIKETETGFEVELAVPGMKKEDFDIEVNEDLLSIRAEQKSETTDENEKFTKREFNYSSFVRSFRLPENVEADKIKAGYKEGILHLEIPKTKVDENPKLRKIAIN